MLHAMGRGGPPSRTFSLRRFTPCFEISLFPPGADRSELIVRAGAADLSSGLQPCGWSQNPHPLLTRRSMFADANINDFAQC